MLASLQNQFNYYSLKRAQPNSSDYGVYSRILSIINIRNSRLWRQLFTTNKSPAVLYNSKEKVLSYIKEINKFRIDTVKYYYIIKFVAEKQ